MKIRSFIAIAALLAGTVVHAEPTDPLGTTGPFYLDVPSPSFDTTRKTYVVSGQRYSIPRNYIVTLSKYGDGTVGVISMRALLPDMTGRSPETAKCFDFRESCNIREVTIGLSRGSFPTSGSQQLQNIRGFSLPDKKVGPCELDYYEDSSPTTGPAAAFNYFFRKLPGNSDVSVLRCSKMGSPFAPRCNSNENIGDGNHFYYNFDRSNLRDWEKTRERILTLIQAFKGER